MPTTPSLAQSEASRQNGARSHGPATDTGKARSALNGVRHGLCGRTFFLLPDEDPAEFRRHEALWLAAWAPRDLHEHEAAEAAIRCMWREERADRLEALVLTDLFAADRIADQAERRGRQDGRLQGAGHAAALPRPDRARARRAMQALEDLRQRRLARRPRARPSEPEPTMPAAALVRGACPAHSPQPLRHAPTHRHRRISGARAARPSEPEPARR